LPEEVSFGVTTIRIIRAEELGPLQVGYASDPHGKPLTGEADGDWKTSWVVIGHDDTCGDPIFIDAAQEGFPVYTAMHGQGAWKPTRIASTIEGLVFALNALSEAARGREYPLALESNPLADDERTAVLAQIRQYNPDVSLDFWTSLVDAS
jgi:hypothetical protein